MAITQADWRKVAAEVIGTFFFFFLGIGSVAWAGDLGVFYVALAHGVGLAIAISALGHISGAHFNPAVTISLMLVRKISPLLALLYIVGQLVGGALASLAVWATLPGGTIQAGVPHLAPSITEVPAILLEAILTFFLLIAIFGTAVDPRATRIGGFGIGLTVFVDILVGGPLTGGVMNPARAIAPAIVAGDFRADLLVYIVGPLLGGIAAALIYSTLFLPEVERLQEPPISEPALVKDRE